MFSNKKCKLHPLESKDIPKLMNPKEKIFFTNLKKTNIITFLDFYICTVSALSGDLPYFLLHKYYYIIYLSINNHPMKKISTSLKHMSVKPLCTLFSPPIHLPLKIAQSLSFLWQIFFPLSRATLFSHKSCLLFAHCTVFSILT